MHLVSNALNFYALSYIHCPLFWPQASGSSVFIYIHALVSKGKTDFSWSKTRTHGRVHGILSFLKDVYKAVNDNVIKSHKFANGTQEKSMIVGAP